MSISQAGNLMGFVESFRVTHEQAERLVGRSLFEAENPGKVSSIRFDIMQENITDGPVCWLENIAIHYEFRSRFKLGDIQKGLLMQYWHQNENAEVHMGHASRKVQGLIKILRKRG